MWMNRLRRLRDGEKETGSAGDGSTPPPVDPHEKSVNSQAKDLPWVREALKAQAELDNLKKAIAEEQAKAEKAKLESEGNYRAALEIEEKKRLELETSHKREITQLRLERAFIQEGILDVRASRLFFDGFEKSEMDVEAYVKSVATDETNAPYFPKTKSPEPKGEGPTSSSRGSVSLTEDQAHKLKKSVDPKERARAQAYFRAKYFGDKK